MGVQAVEEVGDVREAEHEFVKMLITAMRETIGQFCSSFTQ